MNGVKDNSKQVRFARKNIKHLRDHDTELAPTGQRILLERGPGRGQRDREGASMPLIGRVGWNRKQEPDSGQHNGNRVY